MTFPPRDLISDHYYKLTPQRQLILAILYENLRPDHIQLLIQGLRGECAKE